jgi:glutamate synthase (NADPH/NADH) large chain
MNETPCDQYPTVPKHPIDTNERDACALVCAVRKGGEATHGNVKRTIEALARMGHRTGYINGEGDGVGILTDIPRELWTRILARAGLRSSLATNRNFWVAHIMIPAKDRSRCDHLVEQICSQITATGLEILIDRAGKVDQDVLGRNAKRNEPVFWQIAGMNGTVPTEELEKTLFNCKQSLERELGVHFPSFSSHSVVYKVQGTVEILRRYYPELRDPYYASTVTLGHARYSTNTNPIFERAQPFDLLGHNGEFNTISRFRLEAEMLGIPLDVNNSDSQDVDRVIRALCSNHNMDLIEAMEVVFPPYRFNLLENAPEIHQVYEQFRSAFGPFAQGPSAVAARLGNLCVFSVDALGLRPLWFGETEKEYFASSERGVYALDMMSSEPKPLAPGEKIALVIEPGRDIQVLDYQAIQRHVINRHRDRNPSEAQFADLWGFTSQTHPTRSGPGLTTYSKAGSDGGQQPQHDPGTSLIGIAEPHEPQQHTTLYASPTQEHPWHTHTTELNTNTMAALGWERYHVSLIESIVETQKEQIGALGWDGPLAAMSHTRVNLTDYFKETIAVVTNPAIDREREQAQFSTVSYVGVRPEIGRSLQAHETLIKLETPLLLGGHDALGTEEDMQGLANAHGTLTLDELITAFDGHSLLLSTSAALDESIESAIKRLQDTAINAVREGVQCLILDDTAVYEGSVLWLDPMLVTAAIDRALREAEDSPNLRRQTGIVLRSGALRNLHDLIIAISMGANAIVPYMMYAVALGLAPRQARNAPTGDALMASFSKTITILTQGLEKVTSTIGCHELRGYGHAFSAVGLTQALNDYFGTPNYFGSKARGLTLNALKADAEERAAEFRGEAVGRLSNPDRFYPKMWKKVESVAHGELSLEEYTETLLNLEDTIPVALRHLMGLKTVESAITPDQVDTSIGDHDMPLVIGAMSFGSQGELSYKSYAEAAYRLNIICVNGEGGELQDIMGKYPHNRGQQIASGRFGVNIEFLNSCNLLEIKVGQGAKPGEGGHLPGFKVNDQVAAARKTSPGVSLISPSNNHDLYSIEDLAQLIDELKTANPNARVSVKIPIVPGVGIIAVGVAKAGANIINLTGYEGGTGAARAHALRYVGLPAEIGVWLAHHELSASGLRDKVELWCDGGMRSGRDVVKMLCLGANRVGFGTMAMVAVGCTICRKCHEGTCHVGITTHIKTKEEATKKGLRSFEPRNYDRAVEGIYNVFKLVQDDIKKWTAKLGYTRTADLVGRADLLEQIALKDRVDLDVLSKPAPSLQKTQLQPGVGRRITRPQNTLSKQITAVIAEYAAEGETELTYDDERVMATDRALGTHLSGALMRPNFPNHNNLEAVHLTFSNSAIPGNGLGAFINAPMDILVEGGAQDGVAKCAQGGTLTVLKGLNHNGQRLDGSVGKGFAYGAQGGTFIVQGNADTRACIRMSGATVIFGGEISEPLQDELGNLGARANLKGYAFEYMTSGRALVLGDPGPWICAGMTGGVIYQRIQPEVNLTIEAIRRRFAQGAGVEAYSLNEYDTEQVHEMLSYYIETLEKNNQPDAAQHLYTLLRQPQNHFVKISPQQH